MYVIFIINLQKEEWEGLVGASTETYSNLIAVSGYDLTMGVSCDHITCLVFGTLPLPCARDSISLYRKWKCTCNLSHNKIQNWKHVKNKYYFFGFYFFSLCFFFLNFMRNCMINRYTFSRIFFIHYYYISKKC